MAKNGGKKEGKKEGNKEGNGPEVPQQTVTSSVATKGISFPLGGDECGDEPRRRWNGSVTVGMPGSLKEL